MYPRHSQEAKGHEHSDASWLAEALYDGMTLAKGYSLASEWNRLFMLRICVRQIFPINKTLFKKMKL